MDYIGVIHNDKRMEDIIDVAYRKNMFYINCKIEDVVEIQKEEPLQIDSDAFTTIELFAGAGGLALGIEKAGFEPLGLIEFDKDAAESLKTNRPNWRVIHDDIANISCLDLEDYFGIKKENWIYYREGHRVRLPMLEKIRT